MPLPKANFPSYEIEIPSTGKKSRFRPFVVKEEKALLLAQQSGNLDNMISTLKDIIKSCTNGKIKPEELTTFDLEYLFCQLRGKSVGEISTIFLKCDTCKDEKAIVKIDLDITRIPVEKDPKHKNKFLLFDDVGIVMKYPGFNLMKKLQELKKDDLNGNLSIIADCIDLIYQGDEAWVAKDTDKSELIDFLENLNSEQFLKIKEFFETMPRMRKVVSYSCPVCHKRIDRVLEGLENFF